MPLQTIKEAQGQTAWLETCARTVGGDGQRGKSSNSFMIAISISSIGYGALIRTYVQFILAKLRFHRLRPEFNGLFEYEEYIALKGMNDPNEGCVQYSLHQNLNSHYSAVMRPSPILWVFKIKLNPFRRWCFPTSATPTTMNAAFRLWCHW
jgi:huntingtin-interacting protein 1-related protein